MLSLDGISKTFDKLADGYGRGEGGGAVVLRRLSDAEADFASGRGPPVLAVIKATALNQDGKSASFTAPNGNSQKQLLWQALKKANVTPSDISYLETHGTGTPLGDPIEYSAIKATFLEKDYISSAQSTLPLVLGAVKPNVGHLEGAAGMAGLIKTIMCVIHKSCPPNIHCNSLNPEIDTKTCSRKVIFPNKVLPLISSESSMDTESLIAGVSSFGSGGTNSHVIVQSHCHTTSASFYVDEPEENFESRIRTKSRSDSIDNILITTTSKVVFLITGQGSSADLLTKSIGAGLFCTEKVFRKTFTECSEAFEVSRDRLGIRQRDLDNPDNNLNLVDILLQKKSNIKIVNVALFTQCMLYALTVSMAELWESRGVEPDVLLGHSLGEYTVATVANILSIDDGMLMVALRADSIANADDPNNKCSDRKGIMVALRTSASEAEEAIAKLFPDDRILENGMFIPTVSVVNGPASCVVSGHAKFVNEVLQSLHCSHKELVVTNAFHSPLMRNAAQEFRRKALKFIESGHIEFNKPTKNIVSSVTGKCASGNDMVSLEYWVDHITCPVIFYNSLLTLFGNRKSDKPIFPDICIVTEIGPGETLTKLVKPVNVGTIIPQQRKIQWVMSFSGSGVKRSFSSDPSEQEFFQQHCSRALLELKIHQLKRKFKVGNWTTAEIHRWRHRGKNMSVHCNKLNDNLQKHHHKSGSNNVQSQEDMIQVVKNILTDVLLHSVDIDDVDEHTSLVSLGVDSLGAIQFKNQLSQEFGDICLNSNLVFDYPSINSICDHISSQLHNASKPLDNSWNNDNDERSPQMQEYISKNTDIETAFLTTQMQQAMLFYHLSQPESCTFIETFSWIVEPSPGANNFSLNPLNREAFRAAWISTVLAHSSLRSCFDMEAVPPIQKVWKSKTAHSMLEAESDTWFEYVRAPMEVKADNKCAELIEQKTREHRADGGINPSGKFLFKLSLIELVDHSRQSNRSLNYLIVLTVHHAIVDGYSMPIILKTLTAHYASYFNKKGESMDASSLKSSISSFEIFSRYEHSLLESTNSSDPIKHYRLLQLENYWRNLMHGWSGRNVFINMPHAVINVKDMQVLRCYRNVANTTAIECERAARKANVTLASLVHAAWCIVYRLSVKLQLGDNNLNDCDQRSCPDVVYGCTATGRSAPVSNLSDVVGPVINTFPVRIVTKLRSEDYSVLDFINNVHNQLMGSVNCETLPLTEIQRIACDQPRSLFPIIVDYQHASLFQCSFGDESQLKLRHLALVDRIGCPLSVRIIAGSDEINGNQTSLKLISTSECLEYDEVFLKNILGVFEASLDAVSSTVLRDDKMQENRVYSSIYDLESHLMKLFPNFLPFQRSSDRKLPDSSRAMVGLHVYPPPAIPELPSALHGSSFSSSVKVIRNNVMTDIMKNLNLCFEESYSMSFSPVMCLQLIFLLSLKRWSSTSEFSICHQVLDEEPKAVTLKKKSDGFTFAWGNVTFQALLNEYIPLKLNNKISEEQQPIVFHDCSSTRDLSPETSHGLQKLFMLCLHTAGGSAAQFAGWECAVNMHNRFDVKLVCLELPGHGGKLMEKPLSDPIEAVENLLLQAESVLNLNRNVEEVPPFCILGYSMGAILAYELSILIEDRYNLQPNHLFLLAEAAPTFLAPDIDPTLPTAEMARELVEQEWYPREFLDLPDSDLEIFLLLARADLSLELSYSLMWKRNDFKKIRMKALSCPVSVWYGNKDKNIFGVRSTHSEHKTPVQDWADISSGAFTLIELPGGHLIMNDADNKSQVLESIAKCLCQVVNTKSNCAMVNRIDVDHNLSWNCQLSISTSRFNSSVAAGIHRTYCELIDLMCNPDPQAWNKPVTTFIQASVPPVPMPTNCPVPQDLMHEPFFLHHSAKEKPAVVSFADGKRLELSCVQLRGDSVVVAERLLEAVPSLGSSDVVAVLMEKGWEQVVGVLAVHLSQCVYLPMDAKSWSENRVRQVLKMSESVAVLTQSGVMVRCPWLNEVGVPILDVNGIVSSNEDCIFAPSVATTLSALMSSRERVDCKSLGYLIYTSGSTGVPKGVCCHHQGAMNTIMDLNDRFEVDSSDRVLGLSSLSFDLSVYDIFGLLTVGGTVVIPPADVVSPPDPGEWLKIVEAEGITIWNTVPAFMELLVTHAECSDLKIPASLRLIYMSGDWIPVSLPGRIRAVSLCDDIRIISMGGATEAAIWSNMFELSKVGNGIPDGWSSVPYGRPLGNQTMYVLNEELEHCEVWVTGVVFIGGAGVASGYYKNPERTNFQFITHPRTGEYLFRTGDLGRVRPCGNIEILGREDSQVKVNGFRIELGEIERVLMRDKRLTSAVLNVHKNTLCAYVVLSDRGVGVDEDTLFSSLREQCRESLTDYMVPRHFMILSEIPLSSNGKVDRDKLPLVDAFINALEEGIGGGSLDVDEGLMHPKILSDLLSVWSEVLRMEQKSISTSANFFSLGGDSLRSMQVISSARKKGLSITVPEVFNYPTLSTLCTYLSKRFKAHGPTVLGTSSDKLSDKPIFSITTSPKSEECEPYPLIGINKAHFVGLHTTSYSSEGIAPQIYFEWCIGFSPGEVAKEVNSSTDPGPVDVHALEEAISLFVARHSHFRSFVTEAGQMQTLDYFPKYRIMHVYCGTNNDHEETLQKAEASALKTREEMTSCGPDVHSWPLFEFRVTHVGTSKSIVHVTISLFLMDAMGDLIFRQELSAIYRAVLKLLKINEGNPLPQRRLLDEMMKTELQPPSKLSFRDYSRAVELQLPLSDEYQRAKRFWLSRVSSFPPGPELPLMLAINKSKNSGCFANQHRWMSAAEWNNAQVNCAAHFVTIPAMLLAGYSLVIAKWSRSPHFLLNILQCLRHQVHPDVNKTVGNCSSTILCEIDMSPTVVKDGDNSKFSSVTFLEAIQRVGKELSRNLEHACMSGVEVMQELNRLKGKTFQAVAPFIFTTPIGVEKGNAQVQSRDWIFNERFFSEKVPHTACVNAIKADPSGTACASIDIVEGVFPDEVVLGIHRTYCDLIDLMCNPDPQAWNKPVTTFIQASVPPVPMPTNCPVPQDLMHEPFFLHHSAKEKPAVVSFANGKRLELSCVQLRGDTVVVAERLLEAVPSLGSSDVVAVLMEKGWEQVVGVLAVHLSQCVYLPLDAKSWSENRVRQVLKMSESVAVLTQSGVMVRCPWLNEVGVPILDVNGIVSSNEDRIFAPSVATTLSALMSSRERVDCKSLGYLIYTSGSTGVPKGVCCHHQGAMNTIMDLNDRFEVDSSDRVLGLSSLSFDLSVYDIFGLLTVGGTVVIPPADVVSPPDPGEWLKIVEAEGITIWNTVPAFMELLVTHAECSDLKIPASLRLIYMSGDWIPVSLPGRIRAVSLCDDIRIISMGGATEAAIWSNMFELSKVGNGIPDGWSSVPYGRPLGNQTMYVLNEELEHCEVWVTGVVFIGGAGVASGYYKNPERTNFQFITHPRTGEYLFRTGDLGRVRPCGNIEILGREDSQVKVNGFRIELGEIERVLMRDKRLTSAVLNVHKNTLCAYVVLSDRGVGVDEDILFSSLREQCRESLTDYMVPRHFMILSEIPLSSNGKVDRDKLPSFELDGTADSREHSDQKLYSKFSTPATDLENDVLECFVDILKLKASDICCERDSFFQLGGNSVSAIQLIFRILKTTDESISVQDLFSAPTVHGICQRIENKKASEICSGNLRENGFEILCLKKGASGKLPLLLFNPAGASGLCYSDLAQLLDDSVPVYCIDDGGILNAVGQNGCHADSIEQVAESVKSLVLQFAKKFGLYQMRDNAEQTPTIAMGGWSYGGVVSVILAQLFVEKWEEAR